MQRCLIIEDDPQNARYIADGLRELGYFASVAADAVDGLSRAMAEPWDVIVLDRMLPHGVDGLSIVTTLRGLGKQTPVLVLSALAAIDERVKGLKAGCDDYLTKPFGFSELAARVAALVRRAQPGEPLQEIVVADLRLNLLARSAERGGVGLQLQPREFRLLAYLMAHAGQVVTRTMLLEAVWDYRFDPNTNVIDVHISRLRNKIDRGHATSLIHTVRGVGYALSAEVPDAAR
ncbi:response regulator transcription factor [Xylophilus sp. GOD-11R]|uniref:response regulator transcription factor n=1 Tax=Xylophilus sp. GOD-11R TaxID=3089814 RepID=UPI00298CFB3D|nr:response regulator transcription factor [Xylophilus sp. GOD-11R]WPB55532.1 response regulator transcription factor [Xylophilus sp. GOD-11R]